MTRTDPPWPPVTWEEHTWSSPPGHVGLVRRARQVAAQRSYRAAVVPQIAALMPTLLPDVEAEAEDAIAEVARFDGEMGREVVPFTAVMLRGEAIASSDIEHITSSARNIALAEVSVLDERDGAAPSNAALVARNVQAMRRAIDASTGLDVPGVLALHDEIMRGDTRHEGGQLRREQVWIGGYDATPVGAHFVPAHQDRVPAALEDLVAFAQRPDLPRMSQLAISHAQFESIHPFTDGNGRTGRALMHVMLRESGLVRHGVVPLSAGLLTDTARYHAALDAYRLGDPTPIVSLFVTSTMRAVANATQLVTEVRAIRESWESALKARRDAHAWKVLDLLPLQPLLTARSLQTALGLAPTHAPRVMAPLVEAEIVRTGRQHSTRSAYWWSPQLMAAVDDFAVRAGRRRL